MKTILVAEDELVNRELIREILTLHEYDVVEACDGDEALAKALERKPDLILTDIKMPKAGGFQLLRYIREDPGLANTRVIALTAFAMDGDREAALSGGFDGYISKPIDIKLLLQEIGKFISK